MAAKRRALAQRRRALGHSQEQLAALLGVERSTVVRWEAGETEPLPWSRPKLAKVLNVSLDELDELLVAVDNPPILSGDALLLPGMGDLSAAQVGTLMEGFAAMDIVSRREVLQGLLILSGTTLLQPVRRWVAQALAAVPLISPESVGIDALDALESAVVIFRRWDASGAGGLRRKAVVGQLNAVAETLREPHSPEMSQRLFHLTAELAQLAGWMSFDQDLTGVAQRYYLLGLNACKEARSPALAAKILGDMSRLSMKCRYYEDSLDLLQTALYILPRHGSALIRAELLGVESRAHAHIGNQAAAIRAAGTCVEVWQDARGDVLPDWLHYMSQGVDGFIADACIELALRRENYCTALAERAERHTQGLRENRSHGYGRGRILDEIRLANIRLAQDDIAESVAVAEASLELAEPTSSTLVCDRLLRFHYELNYRYPANPYVSLFGEQLHDYLKQAAPYKEGDIAPT